MNGDTLADALPREQARVRDLIEVYRECGMSAALAIEMMKRSLTRAEVAAASGDVVEMIRAFEDLKGYKA